MVAPGPPFGLDSELPEENGEGMTGVKSEPPELIVFDCDGVLVDSEPIANRVMAEAITALGWSLSAADCIARFKGHHLDTVIAEVAERLGRPVPEDWLPRLRADTAAAFERELEPVPGAALFHDVTELPGLLGLT